MGRPSVAAQRTVQIMEATRACLCEHGLAGTTLERVSEQSGLSRSHVRHYVGNRDDLLRTFADWFFTAMETEMRSVFEGAEPQHRLAAITDYLFTDDFQMASDDDAVIRELMTAGMRDAALKEQLEARYDVAVALVTAAVQESRPALGADESRALAYGLWTLAIGSSMMAELGLPDASGTTARQLAQNLIVAMAG